MEIPQHLPPLCTLLRLPVHDLILDLAAVRDQRANVGAAMHVASWTRLGSVPSGGVTNDAEDNRGAEGSASRRNKQPRLR